MNLSDKQQEFVESYATRCVFMGGRYSGKTTALITKANTYAKQYGRDNCLICTPSPRAESEIREFSPRPNCDVMSINRISIDDRIQDRSRIQDVDHVFIDEYAHIPQEDKTFITESDVKSINAAMTPDSSTSWFTQALNIEIEQLKDWETIVAPSYTNPSKQFIEVDDKTEQLDVAIVNGHAILERTDSVLYCVKCSESFIASNSSAIEKLNTYGKFHTVECENCAETFK